LDSDFWGYCYWPPIKFTWPDLRMFLERAIFRRVPVIAAISAAVKRIVSRPMTTGHESRRKHRGLGGRNFR
jgi:hypothetical protein